MGDESEEECGVPDDNRLQSCFLLHNAKTTVSRVDPDCFQQRRNDAFNKFWKHVENLVESTLEDGNIDCFKSIEQWISNSQLCKEQAKLYKSHSASSSRLTSAMLFAGSVDSSDTCAVFDGLCSHLEKQNRCRVARLHPHLLLGKHGVNLPLRSLFKQLVGITPETTDMEILAAWHRERESSSKHSPMVVLVEDAERSNIPILAELVTILSEWASELPLVLIFGMATTGDSLRMMLPTGVTGRLQLQSFHLKPPLDRLEAVVQAVLIDLPFVFTWGADVVKYFYSSFYAHDNSVTSFLRLLKVSCLEHFCKQPLSFLCVNLVEATSQVEFEKICEKLPSTLSSSPKSVDVPREMAGALWKYKTNRRCWSMAFRCFLAAGLHMNYGFADVYYGALKSSTFSSSVVKDENVLSQIIEKIRHLAVSTVSEIVKEWTSRTNHNAECSKDLDALRKQLSSTEDEVTVNPVQPSFPSAPSLTTRRMRSLMGSAGVAECRKPIEPSKGIQKAKVTRMAMEFLERLRKEYIVAPESVPFHKVFCFRDVNALKQAMTGETRKLIHSDLASSQERLKCRCCPSDGSLASSLHDTALAYSLSQEHNELVNVHDWYRSFESFHCENKPAETSKKRGSKRKKLFAPEAESSKTESATGK